MATMLGITYYQFVIHATNLIVHRTRRKNPLRSIPLRHLSGYIISANPVLLAIPRIIHSSWRDCSESKRIAKLAAALDAGGLKSRIYDDIRDDIWLKLWGNLCFNPISALTGATLDIVATEPGTRALARGMMREAQAVAEHFGASFRVDVDRRINGAAKVGAHRTSMLQDVSRGRPIELDALLTSVQEMGRLAGGETPLIDSVLALAQQMGRVKGIYPTFPEN